MASLLVFGLDYQSAEFELRDQLAFATEEVPLVIKKLVELNLVYEAVLLSTCNRTELYFVAENPDMVIEYFCSIHQINFESIKNNCYLKSEIDCVKHLYRVISGLESMVLGETEIVAQIKSALELAHKSGSLGSSLDSLFQQALGVAKDVRNNSEISNVAISMGHAVVNYVTQHIDDLPNKNVLFIGAGQMMQQIAPHFNYLSLDNKTIANRSLENAQNLAHKINAVACNLSDLAKLVDDAAVVVVCCTCNSPLVTRDMLDSVLLRCEKKLIIDLSMPLAIDKLILHLGLNITVFTVDDIAKLVDVGLEKRRMAAVEAEKIIAQKLIDYQNLQRKRQFAPMIKRFREKSEIIRQESLIVAEKQLANGESPTEVIRQLSIQLTNRLIHAPTMMITAHEDKQHQDLIDSISHIYDL